MAAAFHGHLGPWLALGLRAGTYARRHLLDDPFRLEACVRCPGRRPFTCFIDGVQFGSGCTLGKGNISHRPARRVSVTFSAPGRPILRLAVAPALARSLAAPMGSHDAVSQLGRSVFRRPLRDLFRVG